MLARTLPLSPKKKQFPSNSLSLPPPAIENIEYRLFALLLLLLPYIRNKTRGIGMERPGSSLPLCVSEKSELRLYSHPRACVYRLERRRPTGCWVVSLKIRGFRECKVTQAPVRCNRRVRALAIYTVKIILTYII